MGYESTPRVSVVDPFTGSVRASWLAFEEGFRGGVNAILVDFDGDGVDEVAVASGSGRVAEVRFFDLQGNSLAGYPALVPFGERYDGGLNLASGDLDADGDGDLVVAKAHGAGDVQIHESRPGAPVKLVELTAKAFRPFPDKFQAGATIAVGDLGTFSGGSLLNAAAPDGRGEHAARPAGGVRFTLAVERPGLRRGPRHRRRQPRRSAVRDPGPRRRRSRHPTHRRQRVAAALVHDLHRADAAGRIDAASG